jgi:predicted transcriptional regulator
MTRARLAVTRQELNHSWPDIIPFLARPAVCGAFDDAQLYGRVGRDRPNQRDLKLMTRLLDEAIKKVQELPDSVQDDAAEMLFSVAAKQGEPVRLDEETLAAIREGRAQARRGEYLSVTTTCRLFLSGVA